MFAVDTRLAGWFRAAGRARVKPVRVSRGEAWVEGREGARWGCVNSRDAGRVRAVKGISPTSHTKQ